jgi:hypothetical protein
MIMCQHLYTTRFKYKGVREYKSNTKSNTNPTQNQTQGINSSSLSEAL